MSVNIRCHANGLEKVLLTHALMCSTSCSSFKPVYSTSIGRASAGIVERVIGGLYQSMFEDILRISLLAAKPGWDSRDCEVDDIVDVA